MNNISYIGEHLIWGNAGRFFVYLSFISALLASFAYFCSAQSPLLGGEGASWKKLGRLSFRIHSLAVVGIMATLFSMILLHYYEYYYVWEHSSNSMPKRYTLACFWEGQEGSFLLWTFWQMLIGNVLIFTAKNWESPVLSVISLVQTFLASMLLGFYIFGWKIGSNPFTLLRDTPDFAGLPLFNIPDYASKLDGRGLNPLLQNYWMTIHPPTLFLGFASTVVPFAYALSGLWKKKFGEWQIEALPWTFFGVMVLGTGILMGGAWAYEALSFGGFWAWDPVENASLFPWLTLVAAGHVMIIYKARNNSILSTLFFPVLTFILVLYSTFLTRSGILGNTSVHSFTDMGMSGQLLIYLLFFLLLSLVLFAVNWKSLPREKQDEELWSREFWLFLGAIVLLMSCFQIIISTSIPVTNKLFGLNQAPPVDKIRFYSRWQIPFAIMALLMVATGLYFKFKKTDMKQFWSMIRLPLFISAACCAISAILLKETNVFYILLLFSCWFAVLSNFHYWVKAKKAVLKKGGAAFAHIGFGLILMGALISTSCEQVISQNSSGKNVESLGKDFSNATNILLTKGDTLSMSDYYVTYTGKHKVGHNMIFTIQYLKKDGHSGKYIPEFELTPIVQLNERMGNVAEPSTHHTLTKDIYTHITFADLSEANNDSSGAFGTPKTHLVKVGDTLFSSNSIIKVASIDTHIDKVAHHLKANDIAAGAVLKVTDVNGKIYTCEPVFVVSNNMIQPIDAQIPQLGLKFAFTNVNPDTHQITISVAESQKSSRDFVVMEAMVFPYINILWLGCVVMVFGIALSIVRRIEKMKNNETVTDKPSEDTTKD